MSLFAIKEYHSEVEKIIHYGGTKKETAIRNAFYNLLNRYADAKDLKLIPEISLKTKAGRIVTPDGTLKDILRLDHGYWESKDESDDINEEIRKKFDKGYPSENILFEDSQTAVLFQQGTELLRVPMSDGEELDKLLNVFINYEREEVKEFRKAIDHFKQDIPKVTEAIRDIIDKQFSVIAGSDEGATKPALPAGGQSHYNEQFILAFHTFHELCKAFINPDISADDIKEMILQHILSADIFNTIFDEPHFHQENNVARELNKVVETFFTGTTRRETLGRIKHYYDTINATAAGIADHHEKQKFLKVVYENFYKAYNPKAADRLGIVYTPNEIVQFMIRSTDYLLHKHFGKSLDSKNVDILDPATGTGTFICDIIDYLPKKNLEYKYKNELHANELAILPYYIANLNIEYVYKQKMAAYAEFENLCLVDTLDKSSKDLVQAGLFNVSQENASRIKKQNERKISVIIGNPPYNANQQNENSNNKNRSYPKIDSRIKETYGKASTAQNKNKLFDMYARFYRWAMDRVNDDGIITFVTNRSFIDARAFDGFRQIIEKDFSYCYIVDTKSDVRTNPKIAGTTHNVFGIQTGVAIMFLIKSSDKINNNCNILYTSMNDEWKKEIKLQWLLDNPFENIPFDLVKPDKQNNWSSEEENDFNQLLQLINKDSKKGKSKESLFQTYSLGIRSNRDEWVYDFSRDNLVNKVQLLSNIYNQEVPKFKGRKYTDIDNEINYSIKWARELKKYLCRGVFSKYSEMFIKQASFRPFIKKHFYTEKIFIEMIYKTPNIFGVDGNHHFNRTICFDSNQKNNFSALAANNITDLHFLGDVQVIPFYRYSNNNQIENVTDWGLQLFHRQYLSETNYDIFYDQYKEVLGSSDSPTITKVDVFHYVYAVLQNPNYREKYKHNLKRDFPRIPFYDNFPQWAKWGKDLMDLHINYEEAKPYPFQRNEIAEKEQPKAKLKALKEEGIIQLDENTELHGIPKEAWEYKLGNRSALEWILDQYKEKKPSDPTIAEKFNTYCFADYKEKVIDLLMRVCTVSVETMKIINQMSSM